MTNRAFLRLAIAALLIATSATLVEAALQTGQRISFTNQVGTTAGGEFGVNLKLSANPFLGTGHTDELFRTFCLEKNEFIDFDQRGFIIDSISKEAVKGGANVGGTGGNPDPIEPQTAWLFYNFTKGTLIDLDGNAYAHTDAMADQLQNAIWGFEDEIAKSASWLANPFVLAAQEAVANGGADVAAAIAHTFVLNIVWATDRHGFDGVYEAPMGPLNVGTQAQSMLYVVPEVSGIASWSVLGFIGLAAEFKRKRTPSRSS